MQLTWGCTDGAEFSRESNSAHALCSTGVSVDHAVAIATDVGESEEVALVPVGCHEARELNAHCWHIIEISNHYKWLYYMALPGSQHGDG